MALVCDIKSDQPNQETAINEDLEDGEIEDDDEEVLTSDAVVQNASSSENVTNQTNVPHSNSAKQFGPTNPENKFIQNEQKLTVPNNSKFEHAGRGGRFDRAMDKRARHEERKRAHLTEAEKSVMYLHKLERIEREKRERFKREQVVDDFASDIEKAIASVLKKDQKDKDRSSDEEKIEEKRGKKRKKKDKDKKKSKHRKVDSPKPEEVDENEMLNVRSGSPELKFTMLKEEVHTPSPNSEDYDTYDSEYSSDRSRDDKKDRKKDHYKHGMRLRNRDRRDRKYRDRSREKRTDSKDPQTLCVFFLQGKCNKGDECPFSHEIMPTMKLELCKFYLMERCAKGDKCLYMHSQFPCKYYHTGLHCPDGDSCKFTHGKPLHEGLKQILYKHLETAPKEILGDFPRLTREGAMNMLNQTQKNLELKYGIEKKDDSKMNIPSLFDITVPVPAELMQKDDSKPKEKSDKQQGRNRPSRWQDADAPETTAHHEQQKQLQMFGLRGFYSERDQDMRITSNGDIDMRTLPPQLNALPPSVQITPAAQQTSSGKDRVIDADSEQLKSELPPRNNDVDIRNQMSLFNSRDVDIRHMDVDSRHLHLANKDVDIRQLGPMHFEDDHDTAGDEPSLEIVTDEDANEQKTEKLAGSLLLADIDSRIIGQAFSAFSTLKDIDSRVGSFGVGDSDLPAHLPKKQRELFLRIQAQQKENVPENQKEASDEENDNSVDWYSDDDDDDCRLTIKDDVEEPKSRSEETADDKAQSMLSPAHIKPVEVMEKLGDLSKIDISAEVTKLLSTISQTGGASPKENKTAAPRDPRMAAQTSDSRAGPSDPRQSRQPSTENKPKVEKLSIYEQGSLSLESAAKDIDLRSIEKDFDLRSSLRDTDLRAGSGRPDIDLRQLSLPFKAIQNYTPATEIDASVNSHVPISWRVHIVEIPRPDYSGLKLSAQDAQNTGDPRLRKIFRLSVDEKESPASPKESPKAASSVRSDPRRRKMEEKTNDSHQLSYAQQLNMLQSSGFYQSLTSNQKLMLNQELSSRADSNGANDPVLNGILNNLGLVPGPSAIAISAGANANALNILANISNLNQLAGLGSLVPNPNLLKQNPNLLGQNPNIPAMLGQNSAMGPNPGIMSQNPNFIGQTVNPNILAQNPNVLNQMGQPIGPQPGLLGSAPGVPIVAPEFQLNFDPRQGGLLGNAPPFNYSDNSNYNNFNEDYFEGNSFSNSGSVGNNRNERGYSRDRPHRRGRNFNNRINNGRNFRSRNRSNRSHTPP